MSAGRGGLPWPVAAHRRALDCRRVRVLQIEHGGAAGSGADPAHGKSNHYIKEGTAMKIEFEGTLLKFHPENKSETAQLDQLWKMVIGCVADGKKLVPVGQFIPGTSASANFHIE